MRLAETRRGASRFETPPHITLARLAEDRSGSFSPPNARE